MQSGFDQVEVGEDKGNNWYLETGRRIGSNIIDCFCCLPVRLKSRELDV